MKSHSPHQRFLYVIFFIWLLVPLVDLVAKNVLSVEFFAFRAWEVVRQGATRGPFSPSQVFEKTIYGDLANMIKVRKYRQYRHQKFTSDSYGFRNTDAPANTYYPIVIVGDSDMAGSSLSDGQTFSSQLEKILDLPIYNYAPFSPLDFLGDKRFMDNPPKILIWENIERDILGKKFQPYVDLVDQPDIQAPVKHGPGKHLTTPKLSTHLARQIFHEVRYHVTGQLPTTISYIHRDSGMLFYAPGVEMLARDAQSRDLDTVVAGIQHVRDILAKRGITLVYVPLPDKENVYRYLLPRDPLVQDYQEPFLPELHARLHQLGVINVDLYSVYEKLSRGDEYLFFRDDTHWNAKGVRLAVEATEKSIRGNALLP